MRDFQADPSPALRPLERLKDDSSEYVRRSLTPKSVSMGGSIEFSLDLTSTGAESQGLLVDYAIHHRKANGGTTPKVFRLKTLDLAPGAVVHLSKRHPFNPITTRRYYSGIHEVEVIVNGRSVAREDFELIV